MQKDEEEASNQARIIGNKPHQSKTDRKDDKLSNTNQEYTQADQTQDLKKDLCNHQPKHMH